MYSSDVFCFCFLLLLLLFSWRSIWQEVRSKHWWFSGRIPAGHAGDPGSIPGQCHVLLFAVNQQSPTAGKAKRLSCVNSTERNRMGDEDGEKGCVGGGGTIEHVRFCH